MATPTEIADSLTLEEIPIKLRCATCNKLAQDAVRLPCCDQNICADCQATLQQACPICFHEPVNADDCRPNKALRQTVKIFLKKKIIDKENARKKEMLEKTAAIAPPTPAASLPDKTPGSQQPEITVGPSTETKKNDEPLNTSEANVSAENLEGAGPTSVQADAQMDIPQQSIESPGPQGTPRRASTQTLDNGSTAQEKLDENETTSRQQQQQQVNVMGQPISIGMNGSFGFDGSSGAVPNVGFNGMGDFSQMMQFMPNGMPNPMMANFPNMMGMPGMGMDPVIMSQGMYNGFGGPGMMNGMNMGMGFDAGQGAFGGPQTWNAGQDNFNQNGFGGGMAGNNFGANAGYGGFNMPPHQGNFNKMHPHQAQYPQNNDFPQHGYHNQGFQRGRPRGRGGYQSFGRGRGNYNPVGNHANNGAIQQQVPQGPVRRGSPQYTPMNQQDSEKSEDATAHQKIEDVTKDELAPGDAHDRAEEDASSKVQQDQVEDRQPASEVTKEAPQKDASEQEDPQQIPTSEQAPLEEKTKPDPIETPISDEMLESSAHDLPTTTPISAPAAMPPPPSPSAPGGFSNNIPSEPSAFTNHTGRGAGRGFSRRASEYRGGLHGRGFTRIPNGEAARAAPVPTPEKPFMPPVEPKGLGVVGAPTGPKALRQGLPNTSVKDTGFSIVGRASAARSSGEVKVRSSISARSRSRSRSPSQHQSSRHRHHRHRSASPTKEDGDDKRRERHRRHSKKYEDDYEEEVDHRKSKSSRTREHSVESTTKRPSHRNHRDRDYDKEKDKDSGRSSHRSHRSHRDRDRDAEKETEDSRRSSRKRSRSRSPQRERDIKINGASRTNDSTAHKSSYQHDKDEEQQPSALSSRKRRAARDNDEEDFEDAGRSKHRDRHHRKRSKHEYEDTTNDGGINIRSSTNHDRSSTKPPAPTAIPTGPKLDTHAQEREARNRERQMKELQRRAIMGNTGSSRKNSNGDSGIKINGVGRTGPGAGGTGGRKISVKYEDELEDLGR